MCISIFPKYSSFCADRTSEEMNITESRLIQDLSGFNSEDSSLLKGIRIDGYFSIRVSEFDNKSTKRGGVASLKFTSSNLSFTRKWRRRYFVLYNKLLYVYKNKYLFESNPSKPLLSRPIDIEGYLIEIISQDPPFQINLVPKDPDDFRDILEFQFDTNTEFETWIQALSFGDSDKA